MEMHLTRTLNGTKHPDMQKKRVKVPCADGWTDQWMNAAEPHHKPLLAKKVPEDSLSAACEDQACFSFLCVPAPPPSLECPFPKVRVHFLPRRGSLIRDTALPAKTPSLCTEPSTCSVSERCGLHASSGSTFVLLSLSQRHFAGHKSQQESFLLLEGPAAASVLKGHFDQNIEIKEFQSAGLSIYTAKCCRVPFARHGNKLEVPWSFRMTWIANDVMFPFSFLVLLAPVWLGFWSETTLLFRTVNPVLQWLSLAQRFILRLNNIAFM